MKDGRGGGWRNEVNKDREIKRAAKGRKNGQRIEK